MTTRTARVLALSLGGLLMVAGCSAGSGQRASSPSMTTSSAVPYASPTSPTQISTPAHTAPPLLVHPQDEQALAQLRVVAPKATLALAQQVRHTNCWVPSMHLLSKSGGGTPGMWRVMCRVYYEADSVSRYQDVVCIGNFHLKPMLKQCWHWKFHYGDPGYTDGPALARPAPSPLP